MEGSQATPLKNRGPEQWLASQPSSSCEPIEFAFYICPNSAAAMLRDASSPTPGSEDCEFICSLVDPPGGGDSAQALRLLAVSEPETRVSRSLPFAYVVCSSARNTWVGRQPASS